MGKVSVEELRKYREAARDNVVQDYPKKRVCLECGEEFVKMDIEGYTDHVSGHQATLGQWTEAYRRMQEGKERAKKAG